MIKNSEGQVVTAQLNSLTDGTPITSGTTTVTVVKNGIAYAAEGVVSHVAGGLWKYEPTKEETNANHLAFVFSNAQAGAQAPQVYTANISTFDPSTCCPTTGNILEDFKARFPTFDVNIVDQYLPILIPNYCAYYNKPYQCDTKEATLQLLAHLLIMEDLPSYGPLMTQTSKSVKSVSVSYGDLMSKSGRDAFFNTTKYGQAFLRATANCWGGYFV